MELEEYGRHFALEDGHWWFRGRRALAARLLALHLPRSPRPRILDLGCGTGANLAALAARGDAFGCDLAEAALGYCRRRGIASLARADASGLPFKASSFDLVTLFDVLYHQDIQSDVAVLGEVRRVLKTGGMCLITDSALPSLGGPHDEAFGARERYTRTTLKQRVERAGFQNIRLTYFYFIVFPAIFLVRQIHKLRFSAGSAPRSDLAPVSPWLNALLARIMSWEAALAAQINLPLGSSIVCLARKE
jgi:SAM-dependent methyltransferase